MKKLLLIDGNAIIHRAFHAIPPFKTSKGELTNAIYGFSSMFLKLLENLKPDYVAVAFDKKGKTFRNDLYQDYKATRVKAPDTLYEQIPRIKQVVEAFNVPIFEMEGFEADDVIGTLSEHAKEHTDIQSFIATGDMDALQLVNHNTFVIAPIKGFQEQKIYAEKDVLEKYGLRPKQLIDYKGLKGDTSDNIPGVPGIGEKTAVSLLQKYETLEGVYENLGEITGANHQKLSENREQAFLSKKLGTILRNIDIRLNLDDCKTHTFDFDKIRTLFADLEFNSLYKKLKQFDDDYKDAKSAESGQQSLF